MTGPPFEPRPELRVCPGGPMLVRGASTVTTDDGRTLAVGRPVVALCRCGHSARTPYCDGTHKALTQRRPRAEFARSTPGVTRAHTRKEAVMATCDVCGNDYDSAFTIRTASGEELTFDSFECAIHRCAPRCAHCGCAVIGHGVQQDGTVYCCAHCAGQQGATATADRV